MLLITDLKKKTIGVDLDNTLADTMPRWLGEAEILFGIKATKKDMVRYNLTEMFPNLSHDQVLDTFKRIWENDYKNIRLIDKDIPSILDSLHRKFNIYITTMNKHHTVKDWLDQNKIPYDKIIQFSLHTDKHKLEEVSIYIDDFQEIIENAIKAGKTAILLRQPWNDDFISRNKSSNMLVAYNWREIEQLLDQMA